MKRLVMAITMAMSLMTYGERTNSLFGVSFGDWTYPSMWKCREHKAGTVVNYGLILPPCGGCGDVNGIVVDTGLLGGQEGHFQPNSYGVVNGVSFGVFLHYSGVVNGLACAPLNAVSRLNGLQVGIGNESFDSARGLMVGVCNFVDGSSDGSCVFQFGVVNGARSDDLSKVSSFAVQIGVWNILSEGARGIQFGLVNEAEGSSLGCKYLPLVNARW